MEEKPAVKVVELDLDEVKSPGAAAASEAQERDIYALTTFSL